MTKFINVFLITISITIFLALAALGITYLVEPNLVKDWIGIERVEPNTPEEPDEPEKTSASDFIFEGDTVKAYFGDNENIVIPTSYSIGEPTAIEKSFDNFDDMYSYILTHSTINYPITINYNGSEELICQTEEDLFNNVDYLYEQSNFILKCNETTYIDGNDIEVKVIDLGSTISNISSVKTIVIPEGIEDLSRSAFSGCSNLQTIELPSTINNIESNPFLRCDNLTYINVNDNNNYYTDIDGVLYDIDVTTLIAYPIGRTDDTYSFPNTLETIGNSVFSGCKSITKIDLTNCTNLTTIGVAAFNSCNITEILLPSSITTIEGSAFRNCGLLETITLHENVTSIGTFAFGECNSLETFVIESVTPPTLENSKIFINVLKVPSIYVPNESVEAYKTAWSYYAEYIQPINPIEEPEAKVLEGYTFEGNKLVSYTGTETDIVIPSSYSISDSEIVKMTFDEMEFQEYLMMNFEDITYPITITDANSQQYILNSEMDVFENQDIVYPVSLEVEKPIFVEGNDYQVTSVGGFAFSRNENIASVIMPNTIKQILEEAFYGCSNLSNIEFSNKLEIIARSAFAFNSAIISINLPASLTKIEDTAFFNCNGLTSITIPESVTSIGERAFEKCSSLECITINATTPPTRGRSVIPSNVTIIYVPAESVEAYKTAWSDYADYIKSINELEVA